MLYSLFTSLNAPAFLVDDLFRVSMAALTAFLIAVFSGPAMIRFLREKQGRGQPIRTDGPESHLAKKGTPTMGGFLILLALLLSVLLWADLGNPYIWIVLGVTLSFAALGFADDYLKVKRHTVDGLRGKGRLLAEIIIAGIACFFVSALNPDPNLSNALVIPFFRVYLDLGFFFLPWAIFIVVGTGNAVNLTDGLDGLASVPVALVALLFAILFFLGANQIFAGHFRIPFIPDVGELTILATALIGACLGFLWYNAAPASVFMGDTGSLALGGTLGILAVIAKGEILLAIAGAVFVAETLSVMIQVASFKSTGKRVFLMAPLHHHFEKKGWAETKVVIRFWIVSLVLTLFALSSLYVP